VLAALLRFRDLGADPPLDAEATNSPTLDAFWYLEGASSRADGVLFEPSPPYDLEPWVSIGRVWFTLFGAGWSSACALGAAVGTLTVLAGFGLARPLGRRPALLAAGLLATAYPFVQLGRTPLIYGPLALGMAGVGALYLRGTRAARLAAWGLALALPVLLKVHAIALVGGLALAELFRAPARLRIRAGGVLALVLGLTFVLLWWFDPLGVYSLNRQRVLNYLTALEPAGLLERALCLFGGPRRFSNMGSIGNGLARLTPSLLALAALAVLRAPRDLARLDGRARDALALALGWAGTFAVASIPLDYRPLRYAVPLFPAVAVLAAWTATRLLAPPDPAPPTRLERALGLVLAGPWGAVVGAHVLDLAATFLHFEMTLERVASGAAAGALLATVVVLARDHVPHRASRLAAIALVVLASADLFRDVRALRAGERTIERGRRIVARVLPPDAVLAGPYASVLAAGTKVERRRGASVEDTSETTPEQLVGILRRVGYTHFAIDAEQAARCQIEERLAAGRQPLLLVAVVYLRFEPVLVFRFPWVACAPSPYERARLIEDEKGFEAARTAFEAAGALDDPDLTVTHLRTLAHEGAWRDALLATECAHERLPDDHEVALLTVAMGDLASVMTASVATPSSGSR
jgi:hypothetical protein